MKRKQGIWEKVGFLHDGLKKIGSHSFCEHTFFSRFPDNLPLCQYFPLLEAYFRGFVQNQELQKAFIVQQQQISPTQQQQISELKYRKQIW
jgi:hypothetical protein